VTGIEKKEFEKMMEGDMVGLNSLFLCQRQNFNLKASIDLFKKSAL
jgi:hypothetical protein